MSEATADILLHPVRLRIVLSFGSEQLTTAQLAQRLPGVSHATLYRQVATLADLAEVGRRLQALGALRGASDHGATKSLYAADPDGIELEVMWLVPRGSWGRFAEEAVTEPLDLEAELARWGDSATA